MPASPYRIPAERPASDTPCAAPSVNADLAPVLAVVWLAAVARVVLAACHQEEFGAELTLACLAIPALPLLIRESLASLFERSAAPSPEQPDQLSTAADQLSTAADRPAPHRPALDA